MSEQTPPRQGDAVRVVLEGRVNNVTDKTIVVETDRNYMPLPLADISVEVLERADDPSKDPVGSFRRDAGGAVAVKVFQALDWPEAKPWAVLEDTNSQLRDSEVAGWQRLVSFAAPPDWRIQLDGADPAYLMESWQVSGPTEVAVKPAAFKVGQWVRNKQTRAVVKVGEPVSDWLPFYYEPLDMPDDVRSRMAEHAVAGNELRAILEAADAGLSRDEATAYIRDMPEYQTYLNHRKVEDVPLPEPKQAPRVFRLEGRADYMWRTSDTGNLERSINGGFSWARSGYCSVSELLAGETVEEVV